MKNVYTFVLTVAAGALTLAAQNSHPTHMHDGSVTVINHVEADSAHVLRKFKENSPALFSVPDAPRFAIVGKNRLFYLGIGGQVKATVSYDFGSVIDNPNSFTTSAIPMNPQAGNGGKIQFSAMQSSLFLNMVALPDDPNQVGLYVNFNLADNGNYGFDLQNAYLTYRGITAGYDFGVFCDMAAVPPTIDKEGPNALVAVPNGVMDYRRSFGRHFSFGVGAELPLASYTNSADTRTVSQRVPDIPAYLQWAWGGGSRIRLSGILRNVAYRDMAAGKNRNSVGWGVKLSGTVMPVAPLTVYYQAAYGRGMTSYFQDLCEGGLDMAPDSSDPGKLKPVEAWGAYVGLQYDFSPKFFASATYSHVRAYAGCYEGGDVPWGEQYKYAQYVVCNVFYNINSFLQWGMEYIYGRRVDMSGLQRHDNRIQTMLAVNF